MRVGPQRKLSAKELMLLNCGAGEGSWESLGLQGDQAVNPKENQPWIFISRTDAICFGHLMWKAHSLEKTVMLGKTEGKRRRGGRRWDGWMASPTQWTWAWASSERQWRTGKPGMLQSMESQRVGRDLASEKRRLETSWRLTNIWMRRVYKEGKKRMEQREEEVVLSVLPENSGLSME